MNDFSDQWSNRDIRSRLNESSDRWSKRNSRGSPNESSDRWSKNESRGSPNESSDRWSKNESKGSPNESPERWSLDSRSERNSYMKREERDSSGSPKGLFSNITPTTPTEPLPSKGALRISLNYNGVRQVYVTENDRESRETSFESCRSFSTTSSGSVKRSRQSMASCNSPPPKRRVYRSFGKTLKSVSYTHLTLPTIYSV